MAKITYNDQIYIEKILEMSSGYVLDFSNTSFQRFIFSVLKIDVYKRYEYESKAKLLRRIFNDFNDIQVGKLLMSLLEYKREHLRVKPEENEDFLKCVDIGYRLIGKRKETTNIPRSEKNAKSTVDYDEAFLGICSLANMENSQKRGFEFERFLNIFFDKNGLNPRNSFKIIGEQIDGSFEFLNEVYLIEAKWTKSKIQKSDLVIFNEKVASKSNFTRGLFISYAGYTDEALQTFSIGRKVSIVLMTVEELTILIQRKMSFSDFLRKKVRILAEEGVFFKHISELF
ncbi:restriction endonuclease [Peptostreptococcaceae bacterium AGR-M142]